jgi:hypothetical protein
LFVWVLEKGGGVFLNTYRCLWEIFVYFSKPEIFNIFLFELLHFKRRKKFNSTEIIEEGALIVLFQLAIYFYSVYLKLIISTYRRLGVCLGDEGQARLKTILV